MKKQFPCSLLRSVSLTLFLIFTLTAAGCGSRTSEVEEKRINDPKDGVLVKAREIDDTHKAEIESIKKDPDLSELERARKLSKELSDVYDEKMAILDPVKKRLERELAKAKQGLKDDPKDEEKADEVKKLQDLLDDVEDAMPDNDKIAWLKEMMGQLFYWVESEVRKLYKSFGEAIEIEKQRIEIQKELDQARDEAQKERIEEIEAQQAKRDAAAEKAEAAAQRKAKANRNTSR